MKSFIYQKTLSEQGDMTVGRYMKKIYVSAIRPRADSDPKSPKFEIVKLLSYLKPKPKLYRKLAKHY